ncbi:hypothetical protein H4R35_004243 [Dimargaris xerosporica]|nr:hypothetical protein H4R35_004243 [Dimargaris xerosporica]
MATQLQAPTKPPALSTTTMSKGHQRPSTDHRTFKTTLKADVIAIAEQMVNWLFSCHPTAKGATDKDASSNGSATTVGASLPSLSSFIRSVVHRTQTPTTAIITALIYLCRLKQRHPSCKGSPGAGHRLILAALITATKSLYDDAYHNRSWVTVSQGLFSLAEVNQMEMEFLVFLNFRLCVTRDQWCEFVAIIDEKLQSHWERTGMATTYRQMGFSLVAEVITGPIKQRGELLPSATTSAIALHPAAPNYTSFPPPNHGGAVAQSVATTAHALQPLSQLRGAPLTLNPQGTTAKPYSPVSNCVTPVSADSTMYQSSTQGTAKPVVPKDSAQPSPASAFCTPNTPGNGQLPSATSDSGDTAGHHPTAPFGLAEPIPPAMIRADSGIILAATPLATVASAHSTPVRRYPKPQRSSVSLNGPPSHAPVSAGPKPFQRFSPGGLKLTQRLKALSFFRPSAFKAFPQGKNFPTGYKAHQPVGASYGLDSAADLDSLSRMPTHSETAPLLVPPPLHASNFSAAGKASPLYPRPPYHAATFSTIPQEFSTAPQSIGGVPVPPPNPVEPTKSVTFSLPTRSKNSRRLSWPHFLANYMNLHKTHA